VTHTRLLSADGARGARCYIGCGTQPRHFDPAILVNLHDDLWLVCGSGRSMGCGPSANGERALGTLFVVLRVYDIQTACPV
jgi:hypothetical protein